MNGFSFIPFFRNKIKIDKNNSILLGRNVKIVSCNISIHDENNRLEIKELTW